MQKVAPFPQLPENPCWLVCDATRNGSHRLLTVTLTVPGVTINLMNVWIGYVHSATQNEGLGVCISIYKPAYPFFKESEANTVQTALSYYLHHDNTLK